MIQSRTFPETFIKPYRLGYQGQEKDNELKGEGNSLNYRYRMQDVRIGRFFAIDPLKDKYTFNSPYAFSANRVIDAVELEGLESKVIIKHLDKNGKVKSKEVYKLSNYNSVREYNQTVATSMMYFAKTSKDAIWTGGKADFDIGVFYNKETGVYTYTHNGTLTVTTRNGKTFLYYSKKENGEEPNGYTIAETHQLAKKSWDKFVETDRGKAFLETIYNVGKVGLIVITAGTYSSTYIAGETALLSLETATTSADVFFSLSELNDESGNSFITKNMTKEQLATFNSFKLAFAGYQKFLATKNLNVKENELGAKEFYEYVKANYDFVNGILETKKSIEQCYEKK